MLSASPTGILTGKVEKPQRTLATLMTTLPAKILVRQSNPEQADLDIRSNWWLNLIKIFTLSQISKKRYQTPS